MKVKELKMDFDAGGNTEVAVWVDCETTEDIDAIIEWLKMAKKAMLAWDGWGPG